MLVAIFYDECQRVKNHVHVRSLLVQVLFSRQGVTLLVMEVRPVVHWHRVSVALQPDWATAAEKQESAQAGIDWADAAATRRVRPAMKERMLAVCVCVE